MKENIREVLKLIDLLWDEILKNNIDIDQIRWYLKLDKRKRTHLYQGNYAFTLMQRNPLLTKKDSGIIYWIPQHSNQEGLLKRFDYVDPQLQELIINEEELVVKEIKFDSYEILKEETLQEQFSSLSLSAIKDYSFEYLHEIPYEEFHTYIMNDDLAMTTGHIGYILQHYPELLDQEDAGIIVLLCNQGVVFPVNIKYYNDELQIHKVDIKNKKKKNRKFILLAPKYQK